MTGKAADLWALVLAGGDGKRLALLTKALYGRETPKQFSTIAGPENLLSMTMARIRRLILKDQTAVVLTEKHKAFYEADTAALEGCIHLVQPEARGTLAAICWGVTEIAERAPSAVVAVIPSNHLLRDEPRFLAALMHARAEARRTNQVILLGAGPSSLETSVCWMQLAEGLDGGSSPIESLWENPPIQVAQWLYDHGCLWNTNIMVGSVAALLQVLADAAPDVCQAFRLRHVVRGGIRDIFQNIRTVDLAGDVFLPCHRALRGMDMGNAGWSEFSDPLRTLAFVRRNGSGRLRSAPGNSKVGLHLVR